MKSHPHHPGTSAAAAHRQELDSELEGGTSAVPGGSKDAPNLGAKADDDFTGSGVFRDLRRRNERRARFARRAPGAQKIREDRLKVERIAQLAREHRYRRAG